MNCLFDYIPWRIYVKITLELTVVENTFIYSVEIRKKSEVRVKPSIIYYDNWIMRVTS